MAENLDFQLIPYTPEEPDAVNFTLLDGEFDPYPGYKIKVLREERGGVLINKVLREERGGVLINKILLEVVDGDDTPPVLSNPELSIVE